VKKKTLTLNLIENFEKSAGDMSADLSEKLTAIKERLHALSEEEVQQYDGAVTIPAADQPHNDNDPLEMLYQCYSDIERTAYTGEPNEELHRVVQQMRGLFDAPDRYFP
jgi:hypothetical protein